MRTILSWSGGKDCYWALRELGSDVVALLATYNVTTSRAAFHEVHIELLQTQADSLGLPLVRVALPEDASNAAYEPALLAGIAASREHFDLEAIAFGDINLAEIRAYRERVLADCGLELRFPLWGRRTAELAQAMLDSGMDAWVICIQDSVMPAAALYDWYSDEAFLAALPPGVDPCGENGEFHTFVVNGPGFAHEVRYTLAGVTSSRGYTSKILLPWDGPRQADGDP
jgi:uncharacterized protein (TIGR00290 family)